MTLPLLIQDLLLQDLTARSAALQGGAVTSLALTQQVLAAIDLRNAQLNAFLHIDARGALKAAAQSDARRISGQARGRLGVCCGRRAVRAGAGWRHPGLRACTCQLLRRGGLQGQLWRGFRARQRGLRLQPGPHRPAHPVAARLASRHASDKKIDSLCADTRSVTRRPAIQNPRWVVARDIQAARWFGLGDVMLLPSAPQTAFRFDAAVPANQADFTGLANMAGIPALSAPLPVLPGTLPIGLQCIAPAGGEATLLNLNLKGI